MVFSDIMRPGIYVHVETAMNDCVVNPVFKGVVLFCTTEMVALPSGAQNSFRIRTVWILYTVSTLYIACTVTDASCNSEGS